MIVILPQAVNHLLDHLPSEVWSNPTAFFLDPGCGVGIFMAAMYERLFHGLASVIPSESKRHQHILRHVHGVELSPLLTALNQQLLQWPNVTCEDFLALDIREGIQYNVIVGYPPHKLINDVVCHRFAFKAIDMLAPGGHSLLFICCKWMNNEPATKVSLYSMHCIRKCPQCCCPADAFMLRRSPKPAKVRRRPAMRSSRISEQSCMRLAF